MNAIHESILALCEYSFLIKEICNPLFKEVGLNYFNYQVLYDDGRRLHLNADPRWLEHYYEKKYYNVSRSDLKPDSYKNGFGLWDSWNINMDIGCRTIAKDARENFDFAHGIMLTKRLANHAVIFEFATQEKNYAINNFYMSNLDILENFIFLFNKKAEKLIKSASMHMFKIKRDFYPTPDDTYSYKIIVPKQEVLPKNKNSTFLYQPLTARELVCIDWMAKGKTANEIGLILEISNRTVEKHIVHIKEKLGCYTLYQLGKKISELGLERFLLPAN